MTPEAKSVTLLGFILFISTVLRSGVDPRLDWSPDSGLSPDSDKVSPVDCFKSGKDFLKTFGLPVETSPDRSSLKKALTGEIFLGSPPVAMMAEKQERIDF
jgi:hypothetical protein